jgi:hypothetical protein
MDHVVITIDSEDIVVDDIDVFEDTDQDEKMPLAHFNKMLL